MEVQYATLLVSTNIRAPLLVTRYNEIDRRDDDLVNHHKLDSVGRLAQTAILKGCFRFLSSTISSAVME